MTMGRSQAKKWRSPTKKWRSLTKKQRSGKHAAIPDEEMVVPSDLVYDQSCELVLELLERLFALLVLLNDAFYCMYPPQQHFRCSPALQHHPADHERLTTVAGQGERMSFVGMLLRTADRIRWLLRKSLKDGEPFEKKLKKVKCHNPEYAHGVAVLHFLTAGLCRLWIDPDSLTLLYLLHLLHALKEAGKTCKYYHSPIELHEFYTEKSRNCTMNLISHLLNRCSACATTEGVKVYRAKLGADLDPSNWHGCSDCESMLVDILVYTNMLSITNCRMLASMRLSLDYDIDVSACGYLHQGPEVIGRSLFKLGFTEISIRQGTIQRSAYDLLYKVSMDFEVLFISGRQEEKDDLNCLVMEGFLKRKERRPFFILCDHQLLRYDSHRKCCEPQIRKHVEKLICELAHAHQPSVLRTATVSMVLEQGACEVCEKEHIPAMKFQLAQHGIPLQLVTMLPYIPNSVFLRRLTERGGPVRLQRHLCPFEERHACVVHKCKHVRCPHKYCYYSKPDKVLQWMMS